MNTTAQPAFVHSTSTNPYPELDRLAPETTLDIFEATSQFVPPLFDATEYNIKDYTKGACTKNCYTRAKVQFGRSSDPANSAIPWNKDGPNGKDDNENSESVLLAWLCEGDNYSKYRGDVSPSNGGNGGKTKSWFAGKIAEKIANKGIVKPRTPKDIMSKISAWEQYYMQHQLK